MQENEDARPTRRRRKKCGLKFSSTRQLKTVRLGTIKCLRSKKETTPKLRSRECSMSSSHKHTLVVKKVWRS